MADEVNHVIDAVKYAAQQKVDREHLGSMKPGSAIWLDEAAEIDPHAARQLAEKFRASYGQIHKKPTTAADLSTPEMIMELLGRGYAVMKLPETGGFPEAMKGEKQEPEA